jgi:hypothetical protein
MNHEYGHNVEWFFGGTGMVSGIGNSPNWESAATQDFKKTPQGRFVGAHGATGHRTITREPDHARQWPYGVTQYGKSTPHEDFAESMRLYMLLEPIGTLDGKPVWFRDIFPHRAALLDTYLPGFAEIQRRAKEQYRPGTHSHRHNPHA